MNCKDRVSWISQNGQKILKIDFSELEGDDVIEVADYALELILTQESTDNLILYDATDTKLSPQASDRLKEITKQYGYIRKRSAVLGMTGLRRVFFNGFMVYTENKMRAFNNYDAAIEYLTKD